MNISKSGKIILIKGKDIKPKLIIQTIIGRKLPDVKS